MRKKILIIVALVALALSGAFLAPPSAWAQTAPATQYAPGWLARIIQAPQGFTITHSLPPLELGSFVATKSKYLLNEYTSHVKGLPELENVLWVGEAFLRAEEAGNYVFSVLSDEVATVPSKVGGSCSSRLWGHRHVAKAIYVEDTAVVAGSDDILMGSAELEPGLYRVAFRVAGDPREIRNRGTNPRCRLNFDLRVKRPSDDRPLPISQVLLLPVPKK